MLGSVRVAILSVFAVFMLSACASSSPVRYFSLSPIDAEFRKDSDDAVMLGLGPIRMPEYLNRSQIVTRGANAEMQVDEFSRWSEPLTTSLMRIVAADVDNLLQDVVVVVFPYETLVRDQVNYRLIGDVGRFEADYMGRILLEVQWGVADINGEVIVPMRRNRYQIQASVVGDSGAVVVAMNDALGQFSRDIATKLEAALRN